MPNLILACCLQKAYLSAEGSRYFGDKTETLKVRIKNYFDKQKGPNDIIYLIREIHEEGDDFFQSTKSHSLVGSKDIEIPEMFKPYFNFIVNTSRFNAFYKTPLESEIHKIKPDKVILIGLETHTIILFTAEELRNRGYNVSVIEPLILSEDDYLHATGITLLRNVLSVNVTL
jgi:nicotinamidase-related amidase